MASTSAAHHSSSSAAASSRSDCPCKRLSLSLSSATSAEYGDVVSLARRIRNSSSSSSSSSVAKFGGGGGGGRGRPSRIGVGPGQSSSSTSSSSSAGGDADFLNDGGITPLHLAAQHNHAGAVRLLLGEGGRDVDTGLVVASTATPSPSGGMGGATPLHRASFSGAISSMRVLLSWGTDDDDDDDDDGGGGGRIRPPGGGRRAADLLARDASYGDLRTPLHKAVAGGRPLAVQLLIVCASRRRGRGGVLRGAMMRARDASGRTPLESARTYASMSPDEAEVERASVRRWDAVAGGAGADWATCLRLLERAAADDVARDGALTSTSMTTTMGMTPTPDSEEASAALAEGGEAATSRRRGRPRQLVPPYCQKVPETFDDFFNETGNNAYCGDNEGDAACRDGRCLSAAWERTFRTALASSIEMSLDGGGDGGATTPPVDGRGMTTTTTTADLVRYVNNDDVDEVPIINEEFSPSNRPTASIIAQMRSAAKREVEMSSDDCPSFLAEVAVVRNNDESIADENTTAMGRRCDSCGMQTIALFRSMANHQLVCRQCRRRRGR